MDVSIKNRVNLVAWFTVEEMDDLKKICRIRDCAPEKLLRELALCELAQYRSIRTSNTVQLTHQGSVSTSVRPSSGR